MGGEVGLVSIRWWELLFQIANTLVLFAALSYFLFKPVTKLIQDRKDKIATDLGDAEKTRIQAEELKAIYEQKINAAKDEAQQIVRDATRRGDVRREEIIKQAEVDSKEITDRAKVEIERERARAMEQLKDDMVEIALAAASRVIQENMNDESHEKLILQYIEEMGDIHV